jgi:hypothetical protein
MIGRRNVPVPDEIGERLVAVIVVSPFASLDGMSYRPLQVARLTPEEAADKRALGWVRAPFAGELARLLRSRRLRRTSGLGDKP